LNRSVQQQEEDTMFTKAAVGLAVVLATVSGAAATKADSSSLSPVYTNVYNPLGASVGTDPDLNIRFELKRDWGRGN
jgi:hypothetical protein